MDLDSILNDSGVPLEIKEILCFLNNKSKNLENRLNFLLQILNQVNDFIIITDLAGNIKFANATARKFYDINDEEINGYPCILLKTMEGYPTFQEIIDKVNEEIIFQQVIPVHSDSEPKENNIHYLSLKVSLTEDEKGENLSLFWYGRDVTESVKK